MSFLSEITDGFPIRRRAEEKTAFLRWAQERAQALGYAARVEQNGKHRNLVIGAPESARVLITAHYDTPAVMPLPNLIIARNVPLFILYQLFVVALMIIASLLPALLAARFLPGTMWAPCTFLIFYYALLILMIAGPANRHNVNDNTSGVAAVLETLARLPEAARGAAAFVLFDNEEKGKQGSKAFAKAHPQIKRGTPVVNLDCVGVGEHMLVIPRPYARLTAEYALLEKSFADKDGRCIRFFRGRAWLCNSDQASFRLGIMIVACRRKKGVGYYTPAIHTRRDTWADEGNLQYLTEGLSAFIGGLARAE